MALNTRQVYAQLKDEKIKKTLDTLRVIEEAAQEYREKDSVREDTDENQEDIE